MKCDWMKGDRKLKNGATVLTFGPSRGGTGGSLEQWPVLARTVSGEIVSWWVGEEGYAGMGHYMGAAVDAFENRAGMTLQEAFLSDGTNYEWRD